MASCRRSDRHGIRPRPGYRPSDHVVSPWPRRAAAICAPRKTAGAGRRTIRAGSRSKLSYVTMPAACSVPSADDIALLKNTRKDCPARLRPALACGRQERQYRPGALPTASSGNRSRTGRHLRRAAIGGVADRNPLRAGRWQYPSDRDQLVQHASGLRMDLTRIGALPEARHRFLRRCHTEPGCAGHRRAGDTGRCGGRRRSQVDAGTRGRRPLLCRFGAARTLAPDSVRLAHGRSGG